MSWIELHITTTAEHADAWSLELPSWGAKAITLKDAGDQPIYEPSPQTPRVWPITIVTALFEQDQPIEPLIAHLNIQENIISFDIHALEDEDWVRRSLAHFKPLNFGNRLWICPSWEQPPDPNGVNVILDPGLAFGTGTHPTTALCLEWLDENIKNQRLAIDYGCGSGILGIAAHQLGVKKIIAVDNDPQALLAATHNAQQNTISSLDFVTQLPDEAILKPADLILANILAQPLISLAPKLASLIIKQGHIVLSGVLVDQVEAVKHAYLPWFDFQPPVFKEEWVRLVGVKH
jgi:ribosomal protein L11 methyltransferase